MFKKSRIKIILSIMSVLILLLAGTLCVIYFSSYIDVYQRDQEMLERYVSSYSLNSNPENSDIDFLPDMDIPPKDGAPQDDVPPKPTNKEHIFHLSTFYSVAFSDDGEMINIDGNNSSLYSDEDLVEFANSIIQKGKVKGSYNNLYYRVDNSDNYVLVAFMDKSVVDETISTLLKYTLVFGAIAFAIIFLLALFLSKRIVRPLEENYKKQKQFISDAGHELKTPVSVINANAEILSRQIGENQWLSNIQYENNRMSALIKQLMELTKTENTKADMTQVDFSRIVIGEILPFESIAFEKGLELSYNDVSKNVMVNGNAQQLGQLVSILIDNAIEHSFEQSKITVSLSVKHNKVNLSVTNAGEEIPKEQRTLIFERFYRADFARTGDDNHYGLGLAIAKAIVSSHHGDITVFCEQGLVTFTASIPL